MLAPRFEAMPPELRRLPRWVIWRGKKVPHCPTAANSKASVTNPDSWGSFDQARNAFNEGGFTGVGFVLTGDGLAGVDLDKCVHDGKPSPEALAIMDRAGCRYIELSPSATGLRGFGYADPTKGRRGRIDGVATELYTSGRYLTVTGHAIANGPLVPLAGFSDLAECMGNAPTEESKETEESEESDSHSSGSSGSSVGIPANTLPGTEGERNKCLFRLARYVKGTKPEATIAERRAIVKAWHRLALPVIGSKDFAESWGDFARGWEAVKFPHGATLQTIVAGADALPLPDGIGPLEYGAHALRLVRVCMALAAHHAPEPFYLSARIAGELLGIHFTDASRLLSALRADGVIECVSRGAGRVASRYRFALTEGLSATS